MDYEKTSAFVALLPISSRWCKNDCPHMTLVYSGDAKDHPPTDFNKMAKDAASIAMISRPISLNVKTIGPMGPPGETVAALMLYPTPEVIAMRNFLEKWNRSEFTDFVPHATIGPYPVDQTFIPSELIFDRIMVAWGKDNLVFWLNR